MKVVVAGLKKAELAQYIRQHHKADIQVVKTHPEFVICYGGDGTLLFAERHWPSVPKVMIRHSRVCASCARSSRDTILRLLARGQYSLVEQPLLESTIHGRTIFGINDILVAHGEVNTGLRYRMYLNGELFGGDLLGDGIVVATPLGSTGYFQSITRSTFKTGLGIALNNTIFNVSHLVVDADAVVKVKIDRGPAIVVADNDDRFITLQSGETVTIKRSYRTSHLVYFAGKQYRQFNFGIGESRVPLGLCQMCGKLLPHTL